MNPPYFETVRRRLAERRPASILNVGPRGEALFQAFRDAHPETGYRSLEPREALACLPELPRFDLAFVAGAFETLSRPQAERLIARLRDVHAAHLLLAVEAGSPDRAHELASALMALGLQRLEEHGAVALYEFDIARYKHTPDWLNADHWAHPELFDKFRW